MISLTSPLVKQHNYDYVTQQGSASIEKSNAEKRLRIHDKKA